MKTAMNSSKISNWLVMIALAVLIPVAIVGVFTAFTNSIRLNAIPEPLPTPERNRLINVIENNQKRIDSLCLVIDTLKHNDRINAIRLRKAMKPKTIIINDTLKVE